MYKEYFGLKDVPFSIAPDPRFLYMSEGHREALAHLAYGVNSDGGFVLLTGEVGTGKTTVCRCLLEQVPEKTNIAFILNPKMTAAELLATFCDELGISYPEGNTSIKVFVDAINAYLLDAYMKGRRTVLIIEEAQNLSADVLEQVRLLTNLETNQRKLLQIIMLGQPELRDMLSRPELRQLAQRITARYHLGPLSEKEVTAYVAHRLAVAGAPARLFTPSVIKKLYSMSGGIPRLINVLCDRALLGAYVQGRDKVDEATLSQAAHEVLMGSGFERQYRRRYGWLIAGALVIVFGTALASTFYTGRTNPPAQQEKKQEAAAPVNLDWQVTQPVEQSTDLAFGSLFRQWNVPYQPGAGESACRHAQRNGLRCLHKKGSLRGLLDLNRPAVLALSDEKGNTFHAALLSLAGETATVSLGKDTLQVPLSVIEKRWAGEYTVLWRVPPQYRGNIQPGMSGPAVKWVDRQLTLARNPGTAPQGRSSYDRELIMKVKDFQLKEGLLADGIVGPETMIRLDSAAGSAGPLLIAGRREK